ncbi:hypothetical protein L3X38_002872 [Prunus dulcis]|uniref:Uncharacterized protein n=1 Tax=Prunus dulcis TaxID=3755 RepID=A0AAD4WZF8_PRUDU|nr:hypothetical protein L3X38_002872 [Prunus dulcis]
MICDHRSKIERSIYDGILKLLDPRLIPLTFTGDSKFLTINCSAVSCFIIRFHTHNSIAAGVVLPPITKRPAGKPPTKRIKVFGEFKRPLKCSRCSVAGHNRKTCKAII